MHAATDFALKHERDCEFRPYPCVVMSCSSQLPYSKMPSHLNSCHTLDFREEPATKGKKEMSFARVFVNDEFKSVPWSQKWVQGKGLVFKFDQRHFYLGLTRMGVGRWMTSVHLLDRPSEVSNYRVKLVVEDPDRRDRQVRYEGPANSLLVAGEAGFEEEVVGLGFPCRIAKALTHPHIFQNKYVMRVVCSIVKEKSFCN